MRVSRPRTRTTGAPRRASDAEEREEDGEGGIEHDHQENGLDDGKRSMTADAFGAARDRQALVAADKRDTGAEERRLDDTEPEAPKRDRAPQLFREHRKGDAEIGPADEGAARDAHEIGVERQQRQGKDQRQKPRQNQQFDRIETQDADGVDFLVHHHGADLGGEGAARAAGENDRGQEHAQLAQEGDAEQVDGIDLGAELFELGGALIGHYDADEKRKQPHDAESRDPGLLHLRHQRDEADTAAAAQRGQHGDDHQYEEAEMQARGGQDVDGAGADVIEQYDVPGRSRLRRNGCLDRLLLQLPQQRREFGRQIVERHLGIALFERALQTQQKPRAGGVERLETRQIDAPAA